MVCACEYEFFVVLFIFTKQCFVQSEHQNPVFLNINIFNTRIWIFNSTHSPHRFGDMPTNHMCAYPTLHRNELYRFEKTIFYFFRKSTFVCFFPSGLIASPCIRNIYTCLWVKSSLSLSSRCCISNARCASAFSAFSDVRRTPPSITSSTLGRRASCMQMEGTKAKKLA